ncbi:MAG: guanylate kinase [Flavobacteriia bacterium]|nr:guanylate kinase [Flavobacteriia bacterium]
MDTSKGKCIVISAPSGAGKTSIVHYLLQQDLGLSFSVSACSRNPRKNEQNGVDYYFLSVNEFKSKIKNNEFVEWEEVYPNNFYGTLKSEIIKIWNQGKTVIFDVDVFGGMNLKEQFHENALSIFICPPSLQILEERLRSRSTESEEKIQTRMHKAKEEMKMANRFDNILENNDLENTCMQAKELVESFLKQ